MSMYLCRRVCCCCYSEKKNANPVTLTRAETITVQPTTSAALEMHQVKTEEIKPQTITKKPSTDDKLSIASDLEEIDLDERIPTDEDLQHAPIPTSADHSFAAAVTDMMLDEIHDNASEKAEISEEPVKIDNDVVAEATEEEVRNTLTRTRDEKRTPIVEKLNFEELHPATGYEVYKSKKAAEPSLPSPEKPPRQIVPLIPEKDIEDEIDEEKEIKNFVKAKENLADSNFENDDASIRSIATEESDVDAHTPEISHLESEVTEVPKVVPLIKATEIDQKNESESEEEESVRTATTATSENSDFVAIKKTSHGNIKDEKAEVEIFENREVIIHDNTLPRIKHRGQSGTSNPPEAYPRPTNMYGNITDSDESSESETESLDVPRKKPNRVSVKQTNVVLTKVTAVDAPPSEASETESPTLPRNHHPHSNLQRDNNYVVLTDDEFSEKII